MDHSKVLIWSNRKLFSESSYDQYPTSYADLKALLEREPVGRLLEVSQGLNVVDSVLYGGQAGDLDVRQKLRVEYALFRAGTGQKQTPSDMAHKDVLSGLHKLSDGALLSLSGLAALDEAKVDSIWSLHQDMQTTDEDFDQSISGSRTVQQSPLDEVTSHLMSSALQRGLELKPKTQAPLDDVAFFNQCVDTLLDMVGSPTHAGSAARNRDSSDDSVNDTATALKDLQLAHSFLTKKFENDRMEYLHSIDKLTKTNKELSHEVLAYHGKVADLDRKCQGLTQERSGLVEQIDNMIAISTPTTIVTSPSSSPGSTASNGKSYSIGVMRTEFKKALTETQSRYEKELREEKAVRRRVEQELEALRSR
ncbi:LADA_0A04764g1_1 [Lachancea dasiensis]|uniref:LADA_0A04764g1_1 n=1 Tax=Lachancea dasiensis TaxID=1072105 RepID=A0A1G4INM9_9SACH|nr:LADA_0A04764g1_1 [Lachancea dasiensis]